jgi:hypothetical protein
MTVAAAGIDYTAWQQGKGHAITGHPGHRGSGSIALLILDLGARREWVVSATSRPLCPRERPGNHCTGGWVGPRAGLEVCEKPRPLDRPARSQSLYRLSYRPTQHDSCCNKITQHFVHRVCFCILLVSHIKHWISPWRAFTGWSL